VKFIIVAFLMVLKKNSYYYTFFKNYILKKLNIL
jgi:hypothetical protein